MAHIDPGDRSGDLYDNSMDADHGKVELGGGKEGTDHHTIYGDGWHRSWDTDDKGNSSRDHVTTHGKDAEKHNL